MKLEDRLKELRERKGLSQKALGDLVGVSQVAVMKIEQGKTLRPRNLTDFARVLGVSADWLLYGDEGHSDGPNPQEPSNVAGFLPLETWDSKTPLDNDDVEVPFYMEVELSAGNGSAIQLETNGPKLRFSKSTLKRQGVSIDHAACVRVSGNSMEPVIPDGATVGVDAAFTHIVDGEMYAIDWAGELYVKVLTRRPGGGLRIRSFNMDEYPDENLSPEEAQSVRVIGRVFWYSVLR